MLRSLRKKKNNEPDKPVISVTFSDKVTPDIDFTNEPVKFSENDVPVVKDRRCRWWKYDDDDDDDDDDDAKNK